MKIVMRGTDKAYSGTPLQIIAGMQSSAFGRENLSTAEFIDWLIQSALVYEGIVLDVKGTTDEERAQSLLDAALATGLATRG